jgi:hypothetical protein
VDGCDVREVNRCPAPIRPIVFERVVSINRLIGSACQGQRGEKQYDADPSKCTSPTSQGIEHTGIIPQKRLSHYRSFS